MIAIGIIILLLLTGVYNELNRRIVLQKELQNIKNVSKELAHHMDSHLKEFATVATTISSTPAIRYALLKSNSEYDTLSTVERKREIDSRNRRWMGSKDINDSFIQKHLTNPVAAFLKLQQIIMPGVYGEIFLTNRYGAMIASTGKLTTLAHAHKYWWKASYHDGEGRIFFDDRGFDTSVEGYVLGVVVPIKNGTDIIGILKCNINIMGPLTDVISKHDLLDSSKILIARTKGLIVAEKGEKPLSNSLKRELVQHIQTKKIGAVFNEENDKTVLIAFSPITITMGSKKFGFGGNYESIDHIKGNRGEGWHVVISLDEEIALKGADNTTRLLIVVGIIFTLVTSFIALLFGKWIAKPLVKLAGTAQKIGEGHLDTRVRAVEKDEIGTLAKALNNMAENLQNTLTSRDNLTQEIELRKKAEETIKRANEELESKVEERTIDYRKAKEEAEQANRLKGEFLTNMSHELRTPLHHISSYAQIGIKHFNINKEKALECFDKVISANNGMLVLINNLFDLSRLEAGKMEYTFEENDVFRMVNENISKFSQQLEEKELSIVMDQPTVSSKIVCDRTKINQVIQNLISNSIKFAKKNKNIFILLDKKASSLSVSVKDKGPGIPEAEMEFIFDGFSQSSKTKTGAGGTGLGLAICKEIIEAHNGKIWAENNPEGGATFHFILPYEKAAADNE